MLRHWTPIGADEFVIMDADHPYVGDHTPMVKLSQNELHGIQQAGLAVREGKSYAGRVILAGTRWYNCARQSDMGRCGERSPNCGHWQARP